MKVIELQYFPPAIYFAQLMTGSMVIEQFEFYEKQSYRNRCRIFSANGVDELSVPVLNGKSKQLIRDVKIDYHQKWVNRHWRAIQSSYGKAPFFEYYAPEFKQALEEQPNYLFELNLSILSICLEFLQMGAILSLTKEYQSLDKCREEDFRSKIHPKKDDPAALGYVAQPYPQVFGNKFVKDLSILDVLFCEGPNAYQIIKSGIIN
jgi:hypothetical protein